MAIAALSNFTVPLASDQSASTQGLLMPKLAYRFRISLENFGVSGSTTELTKQVAEAARPSTEFTDVVIDVYNSQVHYAGKPKWNSMVVKLRDDVTGAVSKLVGEQNQKQFDFFEQSSAASAGDYKFTMRIEMLDGGNGTNEAIALETWECYGCYIQKTDWNTTALSYKTNDPVLISLTIQPDNCVQVGPSASLGAPGFAQSRNTTNALGA
jgi:hypothetical protein